MCDTLSFYLRPALSPAFHIHAIRSKQLAADPGHDRLGRYAALAAYRAPFFEGARDRSVARDAAHQSSERGSARLARKQGLRRRTRPQRGTYSLVAALEQ